MTNPPEDLDLRPDITVQDLLDELTKHANLLIFGRDERGGDDQPGTRTAFRAVVIVGAAVGMRTDGTLAPASFGVLNADGSKSGELCRPELISKLRQIADDMEAGLRDEQAERMNLQ
jgi:hypothetical protein